MVGWNDVFSVVKGAAPVLGAAVSSVNPIAGMAINLISQAFGANKNDPEDLLNKINADPEYQLKLKKIEYDHEEFLQNTSLNSQSNENQDTQNARDREIEITKITGKKDYITEIIAVLVVIGFFLMCALFILYPSSIQDKGTITSPLIAAFLYVMHYYF
jgi:hypothetical protein